MRVHSLGRGFLLLSLLFLVSFCNADDQTFEVVGIGECADCKENNFRTSEAFSGLHVTIDCKLKSGEIKRIGVGELDEGGKFKIPLPQEMIREGKKLKKECYAQLHSAAAIPCPAHNGLEATKIVFKSQANGKNIFVPTKTLQFSAALCTSKFLWPFFKYPPLPETLPWKKNWPTITLPPLKNFGHPWPLPPLPPLYKPKPKPLPPPIPIYKPPIVEPLPPPVPVYKPKPKPKSRPQVVKPLPSPVPVYKPKPKPPVVKPLPSPVPVYKPKPKPPMVKPLPLPVPSYKPKPPVYKPPVVKPLPPPIPVYKPPVVTKPLLPPIPLYPLPPLYKKPCPPFPKIPPKYFYHPKFGHFPPLPPLISHP